MEQARDVNPQRYAYSDIPVVIHLRAETIWPQATGNQLEGLQVGKDISRNPLAPSNGGYAIPITGIDHGPTLYPRSIVRKEVGPDGKTRYIFRKGTGDPSLPQFPPAFFGKGKKEYGYNLLFGLTREEVDYTLWTSRILTENSSLRTPSHVVKLNAILKVSQAAVPLKDELAENYGLEVRNWVDAFATPWEVSDQIRVEQIQNMRAELSILKIDVPDGANDKEIIELFFEHQGFWQVEFEQDVPFRNNISTFVLNPILLGFCMRHEHSLDPKNIEVVKEAMLRFQAQALFDMYKTLLNSIGISSTELQMPDYSDIVMPLQEFKLETDQTDNRTQAKKDRLFLAYDVNKLSRKGLAAIAEQYYGDASKIDDLVQTQGYAFLSRLFDQLPQKDKDKIDSWHEAQIEKMGVNIANALILGLDLHDTTGPKDSIGGKLADLGDIGPFTYASSQGELPDDFNRMMITSWQTRDFVDNAVSSMLMLALSLGVPMVYYNEDSIRYRLQSYVNGPLMLQKKLAVTDMYGERYQSQYKGMIEYVYNMLNNDYEAETGKKLISLSGWEQLRWAQSKDYPIHNCLIAAVVFLREQR